MSQRKLFAHELEARLDDLLLLSLRQRSAKAPAAQIEALPRELQERVLHWAAVAAQTSDDLGWLIASLAAAQAADLGDEFDDWVRAGLDAYDRSGLAATRKALNDYAEACRSRAKHSAQGIAFAAIEGRLSHFLHALDGRPLKLATGPQAWTDSETLWLPERLDAMPDAAGNRSLYKAMAALLWAQTRFGSFNVDPEPELDLWPDREAALRWFAVFEAMRLEARLAAELPGLARDIADLRGPWPATLAADAAKLARPGATAADSLAALAGLREVGAGETPVFPHVGAIDPVAARRVRAARIVRDMAVAAPCAQCHGRHRKQGRRRGQSRPPRRWRRKVGCRCPTRRPTCWPCPPRRARRPNR
jgi:nitric oxide reductase NorD protein